MASPGASARRGLSNGAATALAAISRLDLGHHTGARIEESLLHLRPPADVLDREQLRTRREVQTLRHTVDQRPVAVLRKDSLRRLRAQELEERARLRLFLERRRDCD